jgi:tetratricopeptide (TPR) repeat protein
MATFDEFLADARRDHTEHTNAVAARLEGGLPHVSRAEDVPPYAAFVVHVFGEHLGEWERGTKLLEAIRSLPVAQGNEALQLSVRRGIAALRYANGEPAALDGLAPPDVAQVMCVLCTTHVARHETGPAIAALDTALRVAKPGLPEQHAAIRSLAVAGNNLSAELEDREHLTDEERAAMVRAADTGLTYWKRAGTWLEEERAEYQLARCLLRAGEIGQAREHIARCISICERNDAPAMERFLGNAVRAIVERASGDDEAFLEAKEAALAAYAQVPEGERRWCQRELGELGELGEGA